jgi:hypothetical protein
MRFSHPARSDVLLQRTHSDEAALLAQLWSDTRMESRFFCFENFMLPSLKAQTRMDFRVCILVSPRMPQHHIDRLRSLIKGQDWLALYIKDAPADQKIHDLCDAWYAQNRPASDGKTLHLRIDDDDALSRHFIARCFEFGQRVEPGEALSAVKGLAAGLLRGEPVVVKTHKPYIGLGLGFMHRNDAREISPLRGHHSKTGERFVTMTLPDPGAFLNIFHPAADTAGLHNKRLSKLIEAVPGPQNRRYITKQDELIRENFPFLTRARLLDLLRAMPVTPA